MTDRQVSSIICFYWEAAGINQEDRGAVWGNEMALKFNILSVATLMLLFCPSTLAQVANSNQTIYQDEQQMLGTDQAMINSYTKSEDKAEAKLETEEAKTNAYRLYAEQRINQLEHLKKSGSPALSASKQGELNVLQQWLAQDSAYRARQQAYIDQLDKCINNLRVTQANTLANLNNDVADMRQNIQDDKDQQKFNNQMQMNYYNELKSEMGAASWGGCPNDGTYNSVGGYGMLGGYGYSPMGGRWLGARRGY